MESREINVSAERITYVIGLDVTFTGYFTDYAIALLSLIYGSRLYRTMRDSRNILPKRKGSKSPIAVENDSRHLEVLVHLHFKDAQNLLLMLSGSFYASALMHMTGGLVHNLLQYVVPKMPPCNYTEDTCQDEYNFLLPHVLPLSVLWQIAKMFASAFALSMILLTVGTVICDSVYFPDVLARCTTSEDFAEKCSGTLKRSKMHRVSEFLRKGTRIINYIILFAFVLFGIYHIYVGVNISLNSPLRKNSNLAKATVVQDLIPEKKIENLWSIFVVSILLTFCMLFYIVVSAILLIFNFRDCAASRKNAKPQPETNRTMDALLTNSRDDDSNSSTSENEERKLNPIDYNFQIRNSCLRRSKISAHGFRCIALLVMFTGGMIQQSLGSTCARNHAVNCPLPDWFKHNALYHVVFIIGITMWYVAESRHFREETIATKHWIMLLKMV